MLIDEDWWSQIDFLLKFTLPIFDLLLDADIGKPFLGEVYDGIDTMVDNIMEIIAQKAFALPFVDFNFVEHLRSIVTKWNGF